MTTVSLRAPANCSSATHAGDLFEVDADGFIDAPHHAVEALRGHGFKVEARPTPVKEPPTVEINWASIESTEPASVSTESTPAAPAKGSRK